MESILKGASYELKSSDFDYDLPESLIAQSPSLKREDSKLLIYSKSKNSIHDSHFSKIIFELERIFPKKPILFVRNNSKVFQARFHLKRKTGGQCEVFLLKYDRDKKVLPCLFKPKNKLKKDDILYSESQEEVFRINSLSEDSVEILLPLDEALRRFGSIPLPPYIKRDKLYKSNHDKDRYQTIYANSIGSCAAPTAGFHFTNEIIDDARNSHYEFVDLSLHIGLGTFKPVDCDDISHHKMHREFYTIPNKTIEKILEFHSKSLPIIFIGTTSLRACESFFRRYFSINKREKKSDKSFISMDGDLNTFMETELFIYPKNIDDTYKPCFGNGIITNFHQPKSSLVMLVSALLGYSNWQKIYTHALIKKYRFLSYGDACLFLFR